MLDWCFSWAEGELFTPSHYLTSIGISYNINPRWATHHRRYVLGSKYGKQVWESTVCNGPGLALASDPFSMRITLN